MQQLARIPLTELKIDRSFVHGAHERSHLRVILKSALDRAGQLGLTTVAEGVETLDDWRLLQEFGCCVAQGYLIAKPMPALDMLHWLKAHTHRLHEFRQQVRAQPRGTALPGPWPESGSGAPTCADVVPASVRAELR